MIGSLLAGIQASGASGPAAGMPPGAGAGMRGAAQAVARHSVRSEAPLPRLLRLTGGYWDSAAGQPRRQRRGRRRDLKPGPVRQEQIPGAGGGVEKLQQLRIGGLGVARLCILRPPPDFTCIASRAVIATESSCGLLWVIFNIHNLLKKKQTNTTYKTNTTTTTTKN